MNRLLAAAALLLLVLALPAPVFAHATLVRSFPSYGQNLDNPPPFIEVEFNEAVSAAFTPLIVRDTRGARVDQGDAAVDPGNPNRVEANLKPLSPGLYTAVYRVTSLDGHPVEGTIAFTVGAPAEAPAIDQAVPPTVATPPAVSVVHGLLQLVACLLAGLAAFVVFVSGNPAERRMTLALAAALTALVLTEASLYAVRASGEPWSLPLLARALTATRVGNLQLARLGLGVLAGAVLALAPRLKWPGLLPGLGLLLTFSLQSHAAATGRWQPVAIDWLHLVALAPWVGGVAGLALHPRAELVPRFSKLAITSVLLLAATGTYSALQHIPSWAGLLSTGYGRSLLWKLGLLVPVLGLAAYNRRSLARLTIRTESFLIGGIFVAAGFLTSVPPAGVEMALRQGPFTETAVAEGFTVGLRITPNRLGYNQATVTLTNPDGQPEAGASTGLRLTMLEHEMGTQNVDATAQAPGTYQVRDIVLGMPGEWRVEVVALTRGGREIRHAFRVSVTAPP